jgi:CDP-glucose 4,6-dehydratase
MYKNIYANKKVLITGNTGFKGSWLATWLIKLGAEVYGFSDSIPTIPSMHEVTGLSEKMNTYFGDIRNLEVIKNVIEEIKPDYIFHLAAQSLVSVSYINPIDTISTNVIGTANILEALRLINPVCVVVVITSDKCYENVEWLWGYKETDHLGGRDIYSGSKGAAEVIVHAYYHAYFRSSNSNVVLATGRAGNVIGGGDWAKDRIVADCMRSWSEGYPVEIRSPLATRPWQHVLEPLSGYLMLGTCLSGDSSLNGESFNFGPRSEKNHSVLELLRDLSTYWHFEKENEAYSIVENIPFHEATLLRLNCDKALFALNWEANLSYQSCVKYVSEWYYAFYKKNVNMYELTLQQINSYEEEAKKRELIWTTS